MPGELSALLAGGVFSLFAVFARVGAALMLMPGFGDAFAPATVRLLFALGIALALVPVIPLPAPPGDVAGLTSVLIGETIVGLFLGSVARVLVTALDVAGTLIANQIGLASATMFNPGLETQGTVPGALLTIAGTMLIFATDLHHLLLRALVGSYDLFPAGRLPVAGDLAQAITRVAIESFALGAQLAAPFLIVGTLLYLALGLMARLVPQIQVFFVAQPLQIALGFFAFALSAAAILVVWGDGVAGRFAALTGG